MATTALQRVTYQKCLGVYDLDDPTSIPCHAIRTNENSGNMGEYALMRGENIYVDRYGKLHSRDGYTLKLSGNYKSLWSNGQSIYGTKNGDLVKIDVTAGTFSEVVLLSGVGSTDMNFVSIENTILYTNDVIIGAMDDGITPRNLIVPSVPFKRAMPPGHLMEMYRGVLYIAKSVGDEHFIIFSDAMFNERYDERGDASVFRFPKRVTMIVGVGDGLFVSAGSTYFLGGLAPSKMTMKPVAGYSAIYGTSQKKKGLLVGSKVLDNVAIWSSERGICLGGDGGAFENITETRLVPFASNSGTALIRNDNINQYLVSMKP